MVAYVAAAVTEAVVVGAADAGVAVAAGAVFARGTVVAVVVPVFAGVGAWA